MTIERIVSVIVGSTGLILMVAAFILVFVGRTGRHRALALYIAFIGVILSLAALGDIVL